MTSYDKRWIIERYPEYDDNGNLIRVSYGCFDLGLMGYVNIGELMLDIEYEIRKITKNDLKKTKKLKEIKYG